MQLDHFLSASGQEQPQLSFSQDWNGKDNPLVDATSSGQGFQLQFQNGNTLQVRMVSKGDLTRIVTRWRFVREGEYRLYAITRLPNGQKGQEIFLPAIWYQGNRQGEGKFPSETIAENFSFLETRSSLPCAVVLAGSRDTLCQCISPAPRKPLASVSWRGDCAITTIPGAEWPYSYRGKGKLVPTQDETKPRWHFARGEEYEREWILMLSPSDGVLAAWERFVRALDARPLWKPSLSWKRYGTTKLAHLLSLIRFEEGEPYLLMGSGNGAEQQVYEFTAGSFLVKGLEAATEFATTPAWMLQDPHVRKRLETLMPKLGASRMEDAPPFGLAAGTLLPQGRARSRSLAGLPRPDKRHLGRIPRHRRASGVQDDGEQPHYRGGHAAVRAAVRGACPLRSGRRALS
ncbi:MAG: hypothetical protein SPF89_04390 [Sphaerochaetaceae bacterium]|nr:hypothetical protein [Spirochaetales bacterium]MDY5499323.1 hypothetical protein [Sphaerochaetaceae bacterium]